MLSLIGIPLFCEQLTERLKFSAPLGADPGMRELEILEGIEHDAGNDQTGIPLVVSGNHIPWCYTGAGRAKAGLKGFLVVLPVFPFLDIPEREFPVLLRIVNASEQSLSLLLPGEVEKDLDRPRKVPMEVVLQSHDGAVPILPQGFQVVHLLGKPLITEKLRVHANHQDLFIIGAIENPDPSPLGQAAGRTPKKIMLQLLDTRLFETGDLTALWIDP